MAKRIGKYIVPDGANVWPHEELTAKALIKYGHVVEFIIESKRNGDKTADAFIDGTKWEMKAPRGSTLKGIEQILRRASRQTGNVVIDSRRMKRVPDKAIIREITAKLPYITKIKRLKFVNRGGKVIDVK